MTRSLIVAALLPLVMLVLTCGSPEKPDAGENVGDGGGGDGEANECPNDALEPNELPENATAIRWDQPPSGQEARVVLQGYLCSGEHDWYRVPVEALGFEYNVVRIDGVVAGSSWCAQFEACGGPALESGPEHTLAVEVYDAASMVQLGGDIASDGRVNVDGWGPTYSKDLLIYVYGPSSAATFAYELTIDVRSHDDDGEDECKC